ncbi:hypothetical protein CVD28_08830 [Bacillus sp. M6-12]|uniref:lipopolysaccharide biosynthesis protein n=1 Tax=Bacillus sp. M6-12 TaxID=2054166 RepID=UPI000C75E7B8|nr:oligosaccharide flippase family protein [Bacillus sp. M6-12]PLS17795.1 hypothetical protein CVD28_08830 [Bacillus sp. M6-12]
MFKKIVNRFKVGSFGKNVLILMTGTTVAQAIPLAISPILTRIYSPEEFGFFALYMAIVSILAIIATARYELAIVIPKSDKEAFNVTFLSLFISVVFSLLLLLIIIIFNNRLVELLGVPDIGNLLFLIPITIFLTAIIRTLNYWSHRRKFFQRTAITRVTQAATTAGSNVILGILGLTKTGLIVGGLIGYSMAFFIISIQVWINDKKFINDVSVNDMKEQAIRFNDFPKYSIPSGALSASTVQTPIIIVTSLFGSSIVGFFSLANKTIRLPMLIIANAFGDVFRQKAGQEYSENGNCLKLYKKTLRNLVLISVIPFGVFFIVAPGLFAFVFGQEWRVAGDYAQILIVILFVQFISSPLSNMFIIAEKQKLELIWQTFRLILTTSSIFLGYFLFKDFLYSLYLYTAANILMDSINLLISYNLSKGNEKG